MEHVAIISENNLIGEISYQQVSGDLKDPSRNIVLSKGTPRLKKNSKVKFFLFYKVRVEIIMVIGYLICCQK